MKKSPLLTIHDLVVRFRLRAGELTALNKISLQVLHGERLGIVGESGAGKSVAGFSILNLISAPGYIASGSIKLHDLELTTLSPEEIRKIRGNKISMIFQDPMMTLNPVLTIGTQMIETVLTHMNVSKKEAIKISINILEQVQISSPQKRMKQYPHELSGGMRQRIVIAISLLTNPELIIADEPTTALDVTIQAEIMNLLYGLCEMKHMGLILITHDLGVVSQMTQNVAVMYAGRIIEYGSTDKIIKSPAHPYTSGLLKALPQMGLVNRRLQQIKGMMPNLSSIPQGCAFSPRCESCLDICKTISPELIKLETGRQVACHLYSSENSH